MSPARKALFLVALFVISTIHLPKSEAPVTEIEDNIFEGFTIANDIWNETPLNTVAIPNGFNLSTAIDYSDVAVLINNKSEASRTIGWAFVTARNISADRVFIFDNSSNPTW